MPNDHPVGIWHELRGKDRIVDPPEEVTRVGRGAAPARRGSAIALLALLVWGCAPVGIAEDWREAFVKVYNRTLTDLSVDGWWVLNCSTGSQSGLPPWPSPITTPPPGSVPVTIDLGVPADYRGVLTVIVSEEGVKVVRGEVSERDLPECSGRPPS
jgi:hypothetical protein